MSQAKGQTAAPAIRAPRILQSLRQSGIRPRRDGKNYAYPHRNLGSGGRNCENLYVSFLSLRRETEFGNQSGPRREPVRVEYARDQAGRSPTWHHPCSPAHLGLSGPGRYRQCGEGNCAAEQPPDVVSTRWRGWGVGRVRHVPGLGRGAYSSGRYPAPDSHLGREPAKSRGADFEDRIGSGLPGLCGSTSKSAPRLRF